LIHCNDTIADTGWTFAVFFLSQTMFHKYHLSTNWGISVLHMLCFESYM